MTNKLIELFNKRNDIKEGQEALSEETKKFDKISKKYNKIFKNILLVSIGLMIPMALYIIPIVPTTYTIAGVTGKSLAPILPKSIPLDLLMYPAFLGGTGFLASTAALTLGNILYFIPVKKLAKTMNNKMTKDKEKLNDKIVKENNANLKFNKQNLYSRDNKTPKYEGYKLNKEKPKYSYSYTNNNNQNRKVESEQPSYLRKLKRKKR